ncbi:MAG: alpha/beta hydrolase [Cyanobacteria bacterium SZAS-4]|nr:alpha/beta hydrolase [Cyanobacteria bacterium SZAS-4]
MLTKLKSSSEKPKQKVRWRMTVTKFDLVKLFILYIALSPICAMGLYNYLVFFPFKDHMDIHEIVAKIESAENAKRTDVTIPSGNGQKLDGWLFQKKDAKKIIIVSHGNGGNIDHRIVLIAPLLEANCSVLLYDYEGYGSSTGEATIPAIKQDGLAVYDYVRNVMHYQPKDIIVYGESLGGGVTTYIAKNRPVGAIILQSAFASLTMAAKDRLFWLNLYPAIAFSGIEMDNAGYLHAPHPPVLLLHGDQDVVVPIKHGYKNFAEASEPKKLVVLKGCNHNDVSTVNPKAFAEPLAQFVKELP